MVTAVPTRYDVPHGATCYAGKSNPAGSSPAWRQALAPGHFANISLNTPAQAAPPGWPGDVAGPTATWTGATLLPEFSPLGGHASHGSGHQSNETDPEWAGVCMFDYSTLMFTVLNQPSAPMKTGLSFYNANGECIESGPTAGYTKTPHTYTGVITRSSTEGGAAKGSLVRVSMAGTSGLNTSTHQFDLSPTGKATRLLDTLPGGISYPAATPGTYKGQSGFYLMSYTGQSGLYFFPWNNLANPVQFSSVYFNAYGNCAIRFIPELNCIVAVGNSDGATFGIWVSKFIAGEPQQFVQVTATGTPPANAGCGSTWWPSRNGLYCYEAKGSYNLHKLTPPPDLINGWAWTSQVMAGDSGAVPAASVGGNGAWGRMIYNPAVDCLGYFDGSNNKFQAWNPSI